MRFKKRVGLLGQKLSSRLRRSRRLRWILGVVVLVLMVTIIVQLLYPKNKILPLARVDDKRISSLSDTELVQYVLDNYSERKLTLKIVGPVKKVDDSRKASEAGVMPDTEKVLRGVKNYSLFERLMPFSLIVKGLNKNQMVEPRLDKIRFDQYAKDRLSACEVKPKNAGATVKGETVALDPAKNGQKCQKDNLKKALLDQVITKKGMTAEVRAETVAPKRSDKDVKKLLGEAEKITERKLSLSLKNQVYAVSRAEIASWLAFTEDAKDETKLTVSVDLAKVKDYVAEMQKKIYIAPGLTTITTVDGRETGRVDGRTGLGLNHTTTAEKLKDSLSKDGGTVEGDLLVLPAKVAYERSYTATEAGLAAMLRDLAVDKRIGIAVRFMDGKTFGGEADKQYHPASTYKMFVAYSVLKRIESGQMKWDAAAIGGKNIDQCFEVMIVHSDNTCAEWFGDTIGWQTVSNETRALGLSSTVVVRGKMKTTAADATLFLWKLEKGKILPDDLQGKLLSAMRRQIYRSGIPAGVGVPVADKVGFLDGDLHDAALVYGPKTYSLAIFSSGSSWGAIADAARQVQAQIDRL